MAGNTFGTLFKITTFGESHGPAIGVVIDGCPSALEIEMAFIQKELSRRRPGQSSLSTPRQEEDKVEILSGIYEGKSTGAPICLLIRNKDQKPSDYDALKDVFRPSHGDYTYQKKYGIRDHRGGGRSSARETAARVAAGAIAKLLLAKQDIKIIAFVKQVGNIILEKNYTELDLETIENNPLRCPDQKRASEMQSLIEHIRAEGDSIGGSIQCVIKNCPIGLGEPAFDKLHADLGKGMLSINAVKGFEIGSGFNAAAMLGSEHNDRFKNEDGIIKTVTNHAGGILGGISNGEDIYFNVAFKPVATISKTQQTINTTGEAINMEGKGRHDPCVVPRAVPIVEAMAALVIADHYLRAKIY